MEVLFVGPLLLIAGVVLLYLAGSKEEPSRPAVRRYTPPRRSRPAVEARPRPVPDQANVVRSEPSFASNDVLLADTLSELMTLRSEVAELRSGLDAVRRAERAATARRRRHSAARLA